MTLVYNNGSTKELDSNSSTTTTVVFGILFVISSVFNIAQHLKINLLEKQIQILEKTNKSRKEEPAVQTKPQFKMFVKVTAPKKVTKPLPTKIEIPSIKVNKPVYKEYNPIISNDTILASKMSEMNAWLNSKLEHDYNKIEVKELNNQLKHEEQLVNHLNSDLSILLNVKPAPKPIKFLAPLNNETKLKKLRKIALPIALSIIIRLAIP